MALSNWDTMVLDEKGKPINGTFRSPLGVVVQFYKNWLYVHDRKAWSKGGAFVKYTVMEIESGQIRYKDVEIVAIRGPQEGVFAVVWSKKYQKNKKKPVIKGMIGCGVYGYEGNDFVGVLPSTQTWFIQKLLETEVEEVEIEGEPTIRFTHRVLPVPDEFCSLDWSEALRFNQGDEYFANRVGVAVPSTKVGAAPPTILEQLVKPKETTQ